MPSSLKAEQYMTTDLITVRPDADAYEAVVLLLDHRISGMPVVDEAGKLVGMLSEGDCLKTFVQGQYHEQPTALVEDVMSADVITVGPNAGMLEIAELFLNNKVRRVPIVDGDRLVGQISHSDVLRAFRETR